MAPGEHTAQHECQGVAFADDGAFDLVEDLPGELGGRLDVDLGMSGCHSASMSDTIRSSSRGDADRRAGWVTRRRRAGVRC